MKDKRIQLIIMDLYGIISSGSYWEVTHWLARKYKKDPKDIYAVLYHKYFNQAALGKLEEKEFFEKTLQELKFDLDWKKVRDKHLAFQVLNKPAITLCQTLQKNGYAMLLLSKNIPTHFEYTKKKFGLKKYFKHIVNTYDLRLPKSSKKTMFWVMKKFRVKPEEIVFCDDQNFNLVEAAKMGVKTIHYKKFPSFRKELLRVLGEKAP